MQCLTRSVHEFYARGSTYEELHEQVRQNAHLWSRYVADTSFKFKVEAYNHSIPQRRQTEVIETFDYMDMLGEINMKTPDITLCVFEECKRQFLYVCLGLRMLTKILDPDKHGTTRPKNEGDGNFMEVFFGRLVRS